MKVYKAKRGKLFKFLFVGIFTLPFVIFLMDMDFFISYPWSLFPTVVPFALINWIYFDTEYQLKDEVFYYKSAFLRGKIPISQIRVIIKGKTLFVGIKPALAKNGLIIKYNNFDEIYIASENDEEIIRDILNINKNIKITEKYKYANS